MKRYLYILIAAAFAACSKGEATQLNIGEGRVAISTSADALLVEAISRAESTDGLFEVPESLLPTQEELQNNFELTIKGTYYTAGDNPVLADFEESYASVAEYNTAGEDKADPTIKTPPYLPAGDYTLAISDNRDPKNEGEGKEFGCFTGSVDFTVMARKDDAEVEIVAKLQNSLVRLQTTEAFDTYFPKSQMILRSEAKKTLTLNSPEDNEEAERLLFVEAATKLYLSGSAEKQDPTGAGVPVIVEFQEVEIGATESGEITTVVVDAKKAGLITVEIKINSEVVEVLEESYDLND